MNCSEEGCSRTLSANNKLGLCVEHGKVAAAERNKVHARNSYLRRKEEVNARCRQHYADNKETCLASQRAWQERNPDRLAELGQRYRALELERHVEDYSRIQVLARTEGRCHICLEMIEGEWHVEHIVGYAIGGFNMLANVAAAHPRCNLSKPKDEAVSAFPDLLSEAIAACESKRT